MYEKEENFTYEFISFNGKKWKKMFGLTNRVQKKSKSTFSIWSIKTKHQDATILHQKVIEVRIWKVRIMSLLRKTGSFPLSARQPTAKKFYPANNYVDKNLTSTISQQLFIKSNVKMLQVICCNCNEEVITHSNYSLRKLWVISLQFGGDNFLQGGRRYWKRPRKQKIFSS